MYWHEENHEIEVIAVATKSRELNGYHCTAYVKINYFSFYIRMTQWPYNGIINYRYEIISLCNWYWGCFTNRLRLRSMELTLENGNLRCHERSSSRTPLTMEYQQPRVTSSSLTTPLRPQRLPTVQELALEYSLVIIALGSFLMLSLLLRVFKDSGCFRAESGMNLHL